MNKKIDAHTVGEYRTYGLVLYFTRRDIFSTHSKSYTMFNGARWGQGTERDNLSTQDFFLFILCVVKQQEQILY